MLPSDSIIIWDPDDAPKGNVQHIAKHSLTTAEVEDVLMNPNSKTTRSRTSGRPITFGWTPAGTHIAVIWVKTGDNPTRIYPITAYPAPPP